MKRKHLILAVASLMIGTRRSLAPEGFDPQCTATTIAGYSAELLQVQPPAYAPLKPNQQGGKLRICSFSRTFASETVASIAVAVIPRGARLIGGQFQFSASLGGSATVAFGLAGKDGNGFITADGSTTADGVALLFAATALTATTKQELAATQALKYGYETDKDLYLTMTWAVASMSTQVLQGHIAYVVD